MQRWLKFAKYLPQFGWYPVIITPAEGTAPYYDSELLKDVPPEAEVIKTGTLEPFALYNKLQGKRQGAPVPVGMMDISKPDTAFKKLSAFVRGNVFIPEARRGWVPYATKAALERIKQGDIDIIVSTGPPHSTHLGAQKVARQTGLPWLADLRDPWTNIYYNQALPRLELAKKYDRYLETEVVKAASAVTVVSPGMVDEFGARAKRIELLYNGFDEDDIPTERVPSENFVIAHVGNFFPALESPGLVQALAALCVENKNFSQRLRLEFTGMVDKDVLGRLEKSLPTGSVVVHGPRSHSEATQAMVNADLLLLSIANEANSRVLVGGKVFEYLATGHPIVAIGNPESGAADVLRKAGKGEMMPHDDAAHIKDSILAAFTHWQSGLGFAKTDSSLITQFSRRGLTGQLSQLLTELTAGK